MVINSHHFLCFRKGGNIKSFSIGAGVGYFDSESAIAIGASHYFENNVSIKGSVASGFNSGKSTVVGAGVSYTWK